MGFTGSRPSNTGQGAIERDSTDGLFAPGYLFGDPILPIDRDPGMIAIRPSAPLGEPLDSWATQSPDATPSPIASTRQLGADAIWRLWPGSASALTITLPDGSDIRSLWVPVIPFGFSIGLGFGPGAPMYSPTIAGGELVPIPPGTPVVTLFLPGSGSGLKPDIWVYATHDKFDPSKSAGINITPQPALPPVTYTGLQKAILARAGLKHYYQLNDPAGATSAVDSVNVGGVPMIFGGAGVKTQQGSLTTTANPSTLFSGNDGTIGDIGWYSGSVGAFEFFAMPQSAGMIFVCASASNYPDYGIYLDPNTNHYMLFHNKSPNETVDTNVGPTGGVDFFVLNFTFIATANYQLYINNVRVLNATSSGDVGPLGTAPGMVCGPWTGLNTHPAAASYLSDLALYNRPLTAAEIANDYGYRG